jgi:hypothetical protein
MFIHGFPDPDRVDNVVKAGPLDWRSRSRIGLTLRWHGAAASKTKTLSA